PTVSTLFPYTTLFRSQIALPHFVVPQPDAGVERGEIDGELDLRRGGLGRVRDDGPAHVVRLAVEGVVRVLGMELDEVLRVFADLDRKSTRLNSSHVAI